MYVEGYFVVFLFILVNVCKLFKCILVGGKGNKLWFF